MTNKLLQTAALSVACSLLWPIHSLGEDINRKELRDALAATPQEAGWASSVGKQTPIPRVLGVAYSPSAILGIAQGACRYGQSKNVQASFFIPMGMEKVLYRMHYIEENNGSRRLMIPEEQCSDGRLIANASALFIIGHIINNEPWKLEGYFYLTSPNGEIIKVIHARSSNDPDERFRLDDPRKPAIAADFEAEKAYWLARFRNP